MNNHTFRVVQAAVVLLAMLAASGCGPGRVKVEGRLETDGKPYEVSPDDQIFLIFSCPVGEGRNEASNAVVNKDGTFTVSGPVGKGVATGDYVITLRVTPSIYAITAKKANDAEKFKNAFSDAKTTPLRCQISTSTREVVIDVDKKSATAR